MPLAGLILWDYGWVHYYALNHPVMTQFIINGQTYTLIKYNVNKNLIFNRFLKSLILHAPFDIALQDNSRTYFLSVRLL